MIIICFQFSIVYLYENKEHSLLQNKNLQSQTNALFYKGIERVQVVS